jgi:hypothetical protein
MITKQEAGAVVRKFKMEERKGKHSLPSTGGNCLMIIAHAPLLGTPALRYWPDHQ